MVKKNRIMTLVLAAAVLAVVASGTAFASSYTYDGTFSSDLFRGTVYLDGTSYGSKNVNVGDTLTWNNYWLNYDNQDVTGKAPYSSQMGLTYIDYAHTVLAGDDWSDTIHSGSSKPTVQYNGQSDYTIIASHQYEGVGSTSTSSDMTFHIN